MICQIYLNYIINHRNCYAKWYKVCDGRCCWYFPVSWSVGMILHLMLLMIKFVLSDGVLSLTVEAVDHPCNNCIIKHIALYAYFFLSRSCVLSLEVATKQAWHTILEMSRFDWLQNSCGDGENAEFVLYV